MRVPFRLPLLLVSSFALASGYLEATSPADPFSISLNTVFTALEVIAFIWLAHRISRMPVTQQTARIEKLERTLLEERGLKNALIVAVPEVERGLRNLSERMTAIEERLVELGEQVSALECRIPSGPHDSDEAPRARAVKPALDVIREYRSGGDGGGEESA